jgi:phenylacetate-CoA ligase
MVFTSLNKEAFPLIRFRTRGITSLNPEACICGRTHVRMNGVAGRSDDMLIIRGVNVFPLNGVTARRCGLLTIARLNSF